jgi:hypothetical protein
MLQTLGVFGGVFCEARMEGMMDEGSTGVILAGPGVIEDDVVVTTRTCQIEHKNTQRLSLVRSSA